MTYNDYEQSPSDSEPVELYYFSMEGNDYRFTSANKEIIYDGHTYYQDYFKRGGIEQTGEKIKNEITLTCFRSNSFINQFVVQAPETPVHFTLYRGHETSFVTYWIGTVISVKFNSDEVEVTIGPPFRGGRMSGLRRKYQKQCTYPLFHDQCGVDKVTYLVPGVVSTITGKVVTITAAAAKADGWFTSGSFQSGVTHRMITDHVGNQITLSQAISKVEVDDACSIWAGCQHNLSDCDTKFSNKINYGGQPWIPTRNPFGNDGVT